LSDYLLFIFEDIDYYEVTATEREKTNTYVEGADFKTHWESGNVELESKSGGITSKPQVKCVYILRH